MTRLPENPAFRPAARRPGFAAALPWVLAALCGPLSCSSRSDLLFEEDAEHVFQRGVTFRFLESETLEARVGDFARFAPEEALVLSGVGLVVGLQGTGDREKAFDLAKNYAAGNPDLRAPPGTGFESGTVALVMVESRINPAHGRAAGLVGARLRPLGNAASLENGTLLWTNLADSRTGEVWGVAVGPVLTSVVDSEGNRIPTPTLGRIMSIEVKESVGGRREKRLVLKTGWKELAEGIAAAAGREFPKLSALRSGPLEVKLKLPEDPTELPEDWEAKLLESRFTAGDGGLPRILLDSKSKTLAAVGKRLWINRGTFLLGGTLKVTCFAPARVPKPPSSSELGGDPTDGVVIEVTRGGERRRITTVRWLRHVVRVMDRLGTDFEDLEKWLKSTAEAGALGAEVLDAKGMLGSVLSPEEIPKGGNGKNR